MTLGYFRKLTEKLPDSTEIFRTSLDHILPTDKDDFYIGPITQEEASADIDNSVVIGYVPRSK